MSNVPYEPTPYHCYTVMRFSSTDGQWFANCGDNQNPLMMTRGEAFDAKRQVEKFAGSKAVVVKIINRNSTED